MSRSKGVLAIWHDIEPAYSAPVLEWYNREHHPERVAIPGFLSARRYVARAGAAEYFIVYEVESPEVLGSDAYLRRVNNPTAWTQESMKHFRNNVRTACHIAHRVPGANGAYIATLRMTPKPGAQEDLRKALVHDVFPQLLTSYSLITRSELWTADRDMTTIRSAEQQLRGTPDSLVDWVVVVEASEIHDLQEALDTILSPGRLHPLGADEQIVIGQYDLQYVLNPDGFSSGK